MSLYGCLYGIALHELTHIEQGVEPLRPTIFRIQVSLNEFIGMNATSLVSHHHIGSDIPILWVRSKAPHRSQLRETLHAIFTEETCTHPIVLADGLLSVPHFPVVIVASGEVAAPILASIRRGGLILGLRSILSYHLGKGLEEDGLVFLPKPFGLSPTTLLTESLPTPICPGIQDLVVAAPEGNAGVIAQAAHIVDGLLTNVFKESLIGGVHRAGKHEVLPNKNAVFITKFIETIVLIDTTSPDAQHVHVHLHRIGYGAPIDGIGHARQKDIARDVVGALHEQLLTIEREVEGFTLSVGIRLAMELNGTKPNPA